MEYNESDAIRYIQNQLSQNIKEDDILNIIDLIWDYYESKGLLEISLEDEDEDEDEDGVEEDIELIINYVKNNSTKKVSFKEDDNLIKQVIYAEIEYEKTLDIL